MLFVDLNLIANVVYQDGRSRLEEVAKVVAAVALLSLAAYALIAWSPVSSIGILDQVVLVPVMQEILLRTIIQEQIIHTFQRVKNYYDGPPTEEQLANQKILRIRITAVLFGLSQIGNANTTIGKVVKCFFGFLSGVTYGYLSEKYQTTAAPILAHGFCNGILKLPGNARLVYAVHVAAKIFISRFSRSSDSLSEFISSEVDSAVHHFENWFSLSSLEPVL